jgi:hypothetical protein
MHQQVLAGDVIDVLAVHFEVVHGGRGGAGSEGGDRAEPAVGGEEMLAGAELGGGKERAAVLGPETVLGGRADRAVDARHLEVQDLGGLVGVGGGA